MAVISRQRAAIVVAGMLVFSAIVAGVILLSKEGWRHPPTDQVVGRPPAVRFDALNFCLAMPDDTWTRVPPERVNPDAELAFVSSQGDMAFVAVADAPGVERQGDLETLEQIVLANLRRMSDRVEPGTSRPETLAGIDGRRFVVETFNDRQSLRHVYWLGVHRGHTYQLQLLSHEADLADMERSASEWFGRFSLLDPKRVAHGGKPLEDFFSSRHGYTLRLAGSKWQPWDNVSKVLPEAEWGAQIGNYARCAVIPVSLLGRHPRIEALTAALLARLGIVLSAGDVSNYETPSPEIQRFELSREVAGEMYRYEIQVIAHAGRGYLVAAWADVEAPSDTGAQLDLVLQRFQLQEPPPAPAAKAGELTQNQKQTHAQLFNDLGLYHFNARLFADSVGYFRQAFELLENDPVFLSNVVNAHIELSQFREARDYLQKYLPRFTRHDDLKARLAFVEARAGNAEAALSTYAGLFAAGFRDDAALEDYVELLIDAKRIDEGLAEVRQYLAGGSSSMATRLQAKLHSRKGEHAQAIALLAGLRKQGPFDPQLAYELAEAYLDGQQFHDGLAVCRELLERRYDAPYTYFLKARLELGLKWYAAAKTSLEESLRDDPSNDTTRALLNQVSGMLGEGQNTSIKEPIEPVALPAELTTRPSIDAGDDYRSEYGACFLMRVQGIAFESGREFKTTTRQIVKLFDASGVSRYSTFQFEFDPLAEQLYVNSLRVMDGSGKDIAFGKPNDYFVIDDRAGNVASGRKLLNVPVPGLSPDCTIDLVLTRRDLVPPERFPFTEHFFTADVPILSDSVYVAAPETEVTARASSNLMARPLGSGQAWTIEKPLVYRHEPMQAPLEKFVPHLFIGSAHSSWTQLAADYLASIKDQLEIEPSTRTLAEQVTTPCPTDNEKATALVQLVRDQISYRAIEFGRRARIPNKGSTIIANRYGDCKDHSLLLYQLLKAVGLEAQLALVRTDGTPEQALPSLDQFDHMIVYAPKLGGGRFFDCTDKDASHTQTVPRGLGGRPAFVLDPAGAHFVGLPGYPSHSNLADSQRTVRLVNDADLAIDETLRLEGYLASTLRGLLKDVQPANRVAVLQTQLSAVAGPMQVQKVEVENLDDQSAPLVVKTGCLVKGKFHPVGQSLVGQIPAVWERFFLNAQRVDKRQTPFVARYPLHIKSAITLGVPKGFEAGDMGIFNREEQSSFAEWKMTADTDQAAVRLEFEASRGVGEFSPDQYGAYCDSMDRTVSALAQNVVLIRAQK
jgi:tetratricopeptide (TPR) repeat protein